MTLLGTSSSQPAFDRFPSSQILRYNNDLWMVDCGEGTQIQLTRYKIRRNKIKAIFISHLHGDHLYGLPGVITSFLHYSRTESLKIIGPIGIRAYLDACLGVSESMLNFDLVIEEYDATIARQVYDDHHLEVWSVPLKHRIPTMGFVFREKESDYCLIPEKISELSLTHEEMKALKKGSSIRRQELTIAPADVCYERLKPRSYAYLSDTVYDEGVIPAIKGVDLLYHETTYLSELTKEAIHRMHSTTTQAATIALKAEVGRLIIGHYSSRYRSLDGFENECRDVFSASFLGVEGRIYRVGGE